MISTLSAMAATTDADIREPQVLYWEDFSAMFASAHRQGEHVALVGPNGTGKTRLGLEFCKIIGARTASDRRPTRVTILQYKPRDDTLQVLGEGWPVIDKWPPRYGEEHCVIWPKAKSASAAARLHRATFKPVLDRIYIEGSQTVYAPEAAYFERSQPAGLGMGAQMEQIWSTARSNKLTLISDTQRPRHVTLLMWTEPAWIMVFPLEYHEDLKHIAKLSGFENEVWSIVPRLGPHEFMCIRRQRRQEGEREVYVSKVAVVTRNKRNQSNRREQ